MRVWGAFVDDFIEIKEARLRDSLFAEGLQAVEGGGGEEPGGADGDCSRCGGDFAGTVLFEGFGEFFWCDEV